MIGEGPAHTQATPVQAHTLPVQVQRTQNGATLAKPANGENGDSTEIKRLSRCERAVLKVITDPSQHTTTNAQKAKAVGVSEASFYRILAQPHFTAIHRQFVANVAQANVHRIIDKAIDVATTCGRDGATDRWKLLEYTGHYSPKQQVEHSGGTVIGVVGVGLDDV